MRGIVLLLFVAVLSSCQAAPQTDVAEVRAIIEQHNAHVVGWYAAGQADSVAMLFAEDVWQMPPNAPPLIGKQAFLDFWSVAPTWGSWDFELETQDVVASGDLAVERGKYVLRFTAGELAPEGMASYEDRGNYVVLWRHESDGQWRIVWDAPVSEIMPPGAAAEDSE